MKLIPLSQQGKNKGKYFAVVDDEDYEAAMRHRWAVAISRRGLMYARMVETYLDGAIKKKRGVYLHVFILGRPTTEIDHKDHDGLNCQRHNLRESTHAQNIRNSRPHELSSSKFKGVSWSAASQKWASFIYDGKKNKYLGSFFDETQAATAYNVAAREMFGEYAYLNQVAAP